MPRAPKRKSPHARKTLQAFGLALRARRKLLRYSNAALGREVGVSSKSLCNIESGNNYPSVPVLAALVRVLYAGQKIPFMP